MSKQNVEKAESQQSPLERVISACFGTKYHDNDIESISHSNVYRYGFKYNATEKKAYNNDGEDYIHIVKLLRTANNQDLETGKTTFPDWKCDNGLIEHFQVTVSNDTKGGFETIKINKKNETIVDRKIESDCCLSREYHENYSMPQADIEKFVCSFKKHWEKHIESLRKYNGNKENVCFLIECNDFGLSQKLKADFKYELGISTGRIVENYLNNKSERFHCIMLGRCKELLEYIFAYHDEVQYVIFVTPLHIEIIKTDMANYISSILKEYVYYPTKVTQLYSAYRID